MGRAGGYFLREPDSPASVAMGRSWHWLGARQGQEGGQGECVGRQDHREGLSPLKKTLSQRDGSAMHSLLPVSAWKRQEFDFMTAVSLISFGPGLMAEAVVGRDQKYPHGGYRLQVTGCRLPI